MKKVIFLTILLLAMTIKAQDWSLTGNVGTNPASHFIGTADNQDLVVRTNNEQRIKIYSNGNIDFSPGDQNDYPYSAKFRFKGETLFSIWEGQKEFAIYSNPQDSYLFRVDGDRMNTYLQEDGGRVIIGSKTLADCSTCSGYRLFVKDGIRTEKIKVDIAANNGWADYVFEEDYKLRPLEDLEKFIKNNKHLPEVPTADEVTKNGVELGELNVVLLKKIEELTLYIIEQNKRIIQQEDRIKRLEKGK